MSVYVPTTPNPTSGFFLMLPRSDVVALAMSVDEALKYVISMGVVAPPTRRDEQAHASAQSVGLSAVPASSPKTIAPAAAHVARLPPGAQPCAAPRQEHGVTR